MITWNATAVCDGLNCWTDKKEDAATCKIICNFRSDNKLYLKMPKGWIRKTDRVFCPICSKKLVN